MQLGTLKKDITLDIDTVKDTVLKNQIVFTSTKSKWYLNINTLLFVFLHFVIAFWGVNHLIQL